MSQFSISYAYAHVSIPQNYVTEPGDLPNPGIELGSPVLQADSLPSEPPGRPNIMLPLNLARTAVRHDRKGRREKLTILSHWS